MASRIQSEGKPSSPGGTLDRLDRNEPVKSGNAPSVIQGRRSHSKSDASQSRLARSQSGPNVGRIKVSKLVGDLEKSTAATSTLLSPSVALHSSGMASSASVGSQLRSSSSSGQSRARRKKTPPDAMLPIPQFSNTWMPSSLSQISPSSTSSKPSLKSRLFGLTRNKSQVSSHAEATGGTWNPYPRSPDSMTEADGLGLRTVTASGTVTASNDVQPASMTIACSSSSASRPSNGISSLFTGQLSPISGERANSLRQKGSHAPLASTNGDFPMKTGGDKGMVDLPPKTHGQIGGQKKSNSCASDEGKDAFENASCDRRDKFSSEVDEHASNACEVQANEGVLFRSKLRNEDPDVKTTSNISSAGSSGSLFRSNSWPSNQSGSSFVAPKKGSKAIGYYFKDAASNVLRTGKANEIEVAAFVNRYRISNLDYPAPHWASATSSCGEDEGKCFNSRSAKQNQSIKDIGTGIQGELADENEALPDPSSSEGNSVATNCSGRTRTHSQGRAEGELGSSCHINFLEQGRVADSVGRRHSSGSTTSCGSLSGFPIPAPRSGTLNGHQLPHDQGIRDNNFFNASSLQKEDGFSVLPRKDSSSFRSSSRPFSATGLPLQPRPMRPRTVEGSLPNFSNASTFNEGCAALSATSIAEELLAAEAQSPGLFPGSPYLGDVRAGSLAHGEESRPRASKEGDETFLPAGLQQIPRKTLNAPHPSSSLSVTVSEAGSAKPGLPPKNPLRNQRASASSGITHVERSLSASAQSANDSHLTALEHQATRIPVDGPVILVRSASEVVAGSMSSSSPENSRQRVMPQGELNGRALTFEDLEPPTPPAKNNPGLLDAHYPAAGEETDITPWMSQEGLVREDDLQKSLEKGDVPPIEPATTEEKESKLILAGAWKPSKVQGKIEAEATTPTRKKASVSTGSRRWRFGKDSMPDLEGESNGALRKGRSIRALKTDTVQRPHIRRVFEPLNESREKTGIVVTEEIVRSSQAPEPFFDRPSAPSLQSRKSLESEASVAGLQTEHHLLSPQIDPYSPTSSFSPHCSDRPGGLGGGAWLSRTDIDPEAKRVLTRWHVLRELVETERSYASDLAVVRDVFLARAKARAGLSVGVAVTSPAGPGSPLGHQGFIQHRVPNSMGHPSQAPSKHFARQISSDSNPQNAAMDPTSPASFASSNPSNRSSIYTISSQSSQTSEAFNNLAHPLPPFPTGVSPPASGSPGSAALSSSGVSTSGLASVRVGHYPAAAGAKSVSSGSGKPSFSVSSTSLTSASTATSATTPPTTYLPQAPSYADAPLSAADVRIIFAQLEPCAAFADEMTAALEDAVGSWVASDVQRLLEQGLHDEEDEDDMVGQAFLKLMPRIDQVYASYCSRHEAAMSRLMELSSSQPKAAAFIRECTEAARKHTNAWDLSSLLIKPVQRVLKYPLLLQQILANTNESHPDQEFLRAAFDEIQKVADHINEVKKRKDLVDQIVAGKITKRAASQKVQHGAAKKLLRRQEKVKKAIVGPSADLQDTNQIYYRLSAQLGGLESGVLAFARRCFDWSEAVRETYSSQARLLEQWRVVYSLEDSPAATPVDDRLKSFLHLIQNEMIDRHWAQLDADIRSTVIPMAHRIHQMFSNPKTVIAKRDARELDYSRYRSDMSKSSKVPDRKLIESANAFVALHTQLLDELPQFNYGVQTLLDVCIQAFARLQASHHLKVQRAIVEFWQDHAWGDKDEMILNKETGEVSMRHSNTVKHFWEVHSSVAGHAENLAICTRKDETFLSRSRSTSHGMVEPSKSLGFDTRNPSSSSRLQGKGFSNLDPAASVNGSESVSSLPPSLSVTSNAPSPAAGSLNNALGLPPVTVQHAARRGGAAGIVRSISDSLMSPKADRNDEEASLADASLNEHATELEGSNGCVALPPTPPSKDVDENSRHSLPVLPALTFQDEGFFVQNGPSGLPFLDTNETPALPRETFPSPSKAQVISAHEKAEVGRRSGAESRPGAASEHRRQASRNKYDLAATMAAVAGNPGRPMDERGTRMGYPLLEYAPGDLLKVISLDPDETGWLFGRTEGGQVGWAEAGSFVCLE